MLFSPSISAPSDLVRDVIGGSSALTIPITDAKGVSLGSLQPVTRQHLGDEALIALLTQWRNAARSSFFTQFEATTERTHAWLLDRVLTDYARLLFLVNVDSRPVGTLGFFRLSEAGAELDNMIRGERVGPPTLFLHAERCLVRWLFATFGLPQIEAAVLAGNFAALQLHQSIGFEVKRKVALRRVVADAVTTLVPAVGNEQGECDAAALHLVLDRETFQSREQELAH